FARSYPRVHVEVMCQTSNALVGQLEQGNLDLAIVTRQPGLPKGELLRREGLVWASSDSHSVQAQDTVPLALWQPDCIFRRSALEALDRSGRPWRVTYTSESLAGLQAIVGAGLAVTVLIRDTVPAHFRILGEAEGFPPLPSVEIAMLRGRGQQSEAAAVLERHIVDFLRRPEGEAEQPLLAAAE
ncbi:MAG TPA: LysR substrate-binding domain-containing protein, partial [Alphaproteobacteria bacterium]|nr:LysR substrate-binding domain-containing protein [Alphaproteobacteria bacterium]